MLSGLMQEIGAPDRQQTRFASLRVKLATPSAVRLVPRGLSFTGEEIGITVPQLKRHSCLVAMPIGSLMGLTPVPLTKGESPANQESHQPLIDPSPQ